MDTSQVTNMTQMFYGCAALTTVPDMDTSQVTNMSSMFSGCSSLTSVPDMDTSKVTDMSSMFYGCAALTSVRLTDCGKVIEAPSFILSNTPNITTVALTRLGDGITNYYGRSVDCTTTALSPDGANTLMDSLGTPTQAVPLKLPTTATGCDTTKATAKRWTVTTG